MDMKRSVFQKSALASLRAATVPMLLTVVILIAVIIGLRRTESSGRDEALRVLEEGIQRAVVQCYVVEGRYPDSIAYIEERYGVYIDKSRYVVHYKVIASNVMPEITVLTMAPPGSII